MFLIFFILDAIFDFSLDPKLSGVIKVFEVAAVINERREKLHDTQSFSQKKRPK